MVTGSASMRADREEKIQRQNQNQGGVLAAWGKDEAYCADQDPKEKSDEKTSLRCHTLSEESRAQTNEAKERIWQLGGKWNLAWELVHSSGMSSARPEKRLAAVEIEQRPKIEQDGEEQRLDMRKQLAGLQIENVVTPDLSGNWSFGKRNRVNDEHHISSNTKTKEGRWTAQPKMQNTFFYWNPSTIYSGSTEWKESSWLTL
jgi:hypothetical protein